jgi:hypothetical protein
VKVKYTVEIEVDQVWIENGYDIDGNMALHCVESGWGVSACDESISARIISRETLPGDVEPQAEWWDHASHAYPVATCHLCQRTK